MTASGWLLPALSLFLLAACAPATGGGERGTELPGGVSSHFSGLLQLDDPAAFRAAAAERGIDTTDEGVLLDIRTRGLEPDDRTAFAMEGLDVRGFHPEYERVSAVARHPGVIPAVAALPVVRAVLPEFGATNQGTSGGTGY